MAKMVPSRIPELLLNDAKRGAERAVYEKLQESLGDDFAVYWSRPWHRFNPDGTSRDGEVDFVVGHPDLGVLALEVKGGIVSCDDQGQWRSKSRSGAVYNLTRSPLQQAMEGKHALKTALKGMRILERRSLNLCHGAILADSSRPRHGFGPDAPLELFAFGNDMVDNRLGEWVWETLQRGAAARDKLGPEGMRALHEVVAANFELRPHLARSLQQDMRSIELLTREQAYLLDALAGNRQMAIAGAAGTGKTLLALEKAMRCAENDERTLFCCYNAPLAMHLRDLVGEVSDLTIASFHELCGKLAQAAGNPVAGNKDAAFYNQILPDALEQAVQSRPDLRFDAIIIDEGQDFHRNWYDALRFALRDLSYGSLHVFYDDNQRIYGSDNSLIDELPQASFRLNRNLRNTKSIHQALSPWYDKRGVFSAGPKGEAVEWTAAKSREAGYTAVSAYVSDLIGSGQLESNDIAILTGGSREACALFSQEKIGGAYPTLAGQPKASNRIVCDTVRRFKGLEKKCVVLIDIDRIQGDELIYVGLSRPSVLLKVVGLPADIERLQAIA
ncbi:DUF2075 domain-containing protein [Rhizobium ruizarguesonis]|uniref:AAA family ATPase n=1 Tax=Rhizobium ruizarguesonis TaxID=2081791 RepID=UPI00103232A2|nr:AAA family ATPase [Rhizobium ruizarguesonis]TAZ73770.1 DUF2075 domain-containing protein [Rhizobium ruizarguesonis]TBA00389.1 DUF2075 domain-containing protein [Rhizobium ruizarguesonis]